MTSPALIPPSGTVTFLFTDIEGSTRLWQAHPDAMAAVLRRHDEVLRESIVRNGGYVFKTVGDAFHSAFRTAREAIDAALEVQQRLRAEKWAADVGPLRVRMALHTGVADERDGDYFGQTLNRVARLLSAGYGGQVLLSSVTAELAKDQLPAGASLNDLGTHRLKDLIAPETIFQLRASDLSGDFPPLRTLDSARHNLPLQTTPFIGRQSQVEAIVALLRSADIRLITLTGVGGAGKTRLSLRVAAEVIDEYEHGVFFVDLASVSEPRDIAPAIIAALGIAAPSNEDPEDVLKHYVTGRQMLLVLDNFEQVVEGASLVTRLLAVAPRLEILVTSRELLLVSGEHEYVVPPLALPELTRRMTVAEYLTYEAVALFVNRAKLARDEFELTDDNSRAVAEICARLDGLPLAIELAAARTRLFSPQTLLERLTERLDVLGRATRDRPERQQTLRQTIDWSYNLLDEPEQQLFQRLSVFSGGWDLGMTDVVCGADLSLDVIEGLESLLNKSLVRRVDSAGADPRFKMLVTIGDYAREKLGASQVAEAIHRRHADFFYDLVEAASVELRAARQLYWLNRLDEDIENIRTALGYYLDGGDISRGVRMVAALRDYWIYSYKHVEGETWLRRAAALASGAPLAAQVDVLTAAGVLLLYRTRPEDSIAFLDEARVVAERLADIRRLAWITMWRAMLGPVEEQAECLRQARWSVDQLRALGDMPGVTQGLNIIGERLRTVGDLSAAEEVYLELIPLALEIGDYRRVVMQYANLGMIAYRRRDAMSMLHYARLGFPISMEFRVEETTTLFLLLVAVVSLWGGHRDQAGILVGASDGWLEDMSVKPQMTDAKVELRMKHEVRRGLGDPDFEKAWQIGRAKSLPEAVDLAMEAISALENDPALRRLSQPLGLGKR